MKRCPRCKSEKPLDSFALHGGRKDGRQGQCRSCQQEVDQLRWKDPERWAAHVAKRTARLTVLRQKVWDYLGCHPCVDCGEADPVVLEFDHVQGSKLDDVATLVRRGRAWSVIEAEIAKCEVRCANCHRRRTALVGRWWADITISGNRCSGSTPGWGPGSAGFDSRVSDVGLVGSNPAYPTIRD